MATQIAARLEAINMSLIEALEALPAPTTEQEIERRGRVVITLARAGLAVGKLDQHETNPRDADEEDDMNDEAGSDPEALERKHRALDEGLARYDPPLDTRTATERADAGGAGGRREELASPVQHRAA